MDEEQDHKLIFPASNHNFVLKLIIVRMTFNQFLGKRRRNELPIKVFSICGEVVQL